VTGDTLQVENGEGTVIAVDPVDIQHAQVLSAVAGRLTPDAWNRVRGWSRGHDPAPDLCHRRLRVTWAARVLTSGDITAASLLREHDVGRQFIDGVLPHLPDPCPEQAAAWLRGT
jgi:hypothetical protein